MLWRVLVLAVQLYLTADYCDPTAPGVFSFDIESLFLDSTEARPVMPDLVAPAMRVVLPGRDVLEPMPYRTIAAPAPRPRAVRHTPRAYAARSPPPAPESSEDH